MLPAPKRAAATSAVNKDGCAEAYPSRVFRDGYGTFSWERFKRERHLSSKIYAKRARIAAASARNSSHARISRLASGTGNSAKAQARSIRSIDACHSAASKRPAS